MPLAHSCQCLISLITQYLAPGPAVLDIRTCAMAMYPRGIGQEYAYVMQQSPILDKLSVEVELRMCIHYPEGLVRHVATVLQQQASQLGFLRIVLIK